MNYRSVNDLQVDTRRFAEDLPPDIDLVVGVPRSGLLVANLLCLYLDVPMTDVDGLCEGRVLDTGKRFEGRLSFDNIDSVLVVDDSVLTGGQMTETQERLDDHEFPFDVSYAALYISSWAHKHVDYWADVVPVPRVFEWNVLHHPKLTNFCVDIDGVLCRDPTPEENDDGENYRQFISEVEPNIVPNQRIGWLVTCRLEKYREETETWLDAQGVEYDNLVMMDYPDKQTRQERGNHAQYKAEVYNSTGTDLFIESDPNQAEEICQRTNKPVFCYDTQEMLQPGLVGKSVNGASELRKKPITFPVSASKRLLYRSYHLLSR